ncbi:unnamed protein product [Brachionus calyciflorus]|uniref:Uncharacterized protein n=1 Tax=Brachionus calyciflorus TaxID=104777 RepID=A0A813MG02_9BILA|nr:unnamed protein product [Brachionus calyciflorus]
MLWFLVLISINISLIFTENRTNSIKSVTDIQWNLFKSGYQKAYIAPREEARRRFIWETNMRFINRHNQEAENGRHKYFLAMNRYGDLTPREFRKKMNGLKTRRLFDLDSYSKKILSGLSERMLKIGPKNNTIDWRTKGYVTPVKDQGMCGSCWAFSANAALEGQIFKKNGKLVDLSEQNLVDCSKNDENMGCNGGYMESAYKYIINNDGIESTQTYPYEGKDAQCRFKSDRVGAKMSNIVRLPSGNETALTEAVENIGPIAVAMDASRLSFQFYSTGIYHDPHCSPVNLNHGVTVVGYGSQGKGLDYYIVKNSWGETWGDKGYVLMARNMNNNCASTYGYGLGYPYGLYNHAATAPLAYPYAGLGFAGLNAHGLW